MSQQKIVVANWKQNKTLEEALQWALDFGKFWSQTSKSVLPVVCPPVVFLFKLYEVFKPLNIPLGVQDVSAFFDGEHTGEVGANQIKGFADYAIVGHSERSEDRSLVLQKAELCIKYGITPIVCFKSPDQYVKIEGAIYALEDPQNISRDGNYNPKPALEVINLVENARNFFGDKQKIIYGGSLNEKNINELAKIEFLDGFLVGRASLNLDAFCDIVSKLLL